LIGSESNQEAIGVKVTIDYGKDKKQYREIQSNLSLCSPPQKMAHFGLGKYSCKAMVSVIRSTGKQSI